MTGRRIFFCATPDGVRAKRQELLINLDYLYPIDCDQGMRIGFAVCHGNAAGHATCPLAARRQRIARREVETMSLA